MKQILKTGIALVILGFWLVVSVFLALAIGLMSADEEWKGWSEALPLLLIYMVFTVVIAIVIWLVARPRTAV